MKFATALLLVMAVGIMAQTELNIPDNLGKRFIVGFGKNLEAENYILTFASRFAATVTVKFYQTGATSTYTLVPNVAQNIVYTGLYAQENGNVVENKAIEVTATHEIALYGTSQAPYSTDAFMGLPVDVLGTEYVVVTHAKTVIAGGSYFQVFAPEDGTSVTITPSVIVSGRPANVPFTVTLNKGQAISFYSPDQSDPSGSRVVSSKPVSVFAGHTCANVPNDQTYACDHINNQMPPLSSLGKTFVLVPFLSRTGGDWIRIVGTKPGTVVTRDGVTLTTIGVNQVYEFNQPSTSFSYLEATEPIIVLQLMKGTTSDNQIGDPAMAIVSPVSQWSNNLIVSSVGPLGGTAGTHYISIAVASDKTSGVLLDENPIPSGAWVNVNGGLFKAYRTSFSLGGHTIRHTNPTVGIFTLSYGVGNYDSYAYPGGQRFAALGEFCVPSVGTPGDGIDNDCDGRVDEESTATSDDDHDGKVGEDRALPEEGSTDCTHVTVNVVDWSQPVPPTTVNSVGQCVCIKF